MLQYSAEDCILYIGFRGSVDEEDWLSNFKFTLVGDGRWDDCVKFHTGFKERADNILAVLPGKIREKCKTLPQKIITCGHSLGNATNKSRILQGW